VCVCTAVTSFADALLHCSEMDREKMRLEVEEKKIINEVKKLAKEGQMVCLIEWQKLLFSPKSDLDRVTGCGENLCAQSRADEELHHQVHQNASTTASCQFAHRNAEVDTVDVRRHARSCQSARKPLAVTCDVIAFFECRQ
jgi:hypothetical protein